MRAFELIVAVQSAEPGAAEAVAALLTARADRALYTAKATALGAAVWHVSDESGVVVGLSGDEAPGL